MFEPTGKDDRDRLDRPDRPDPSRTPEDALPADDDSSRAPASSSLDLERQVCFGLSVAARGVVAAYRPLLEPLGLTHPQYLVMVSLWQHGQQSVKQLGALLMLDSGTLSPLLKRLEAMGLVRRARADADERRVLVELTAQGERLRVEAERVHDRVVEKLGLSSDDLSQLQRVLEQLVEATTRTTGRPLGGGPTPPEAGRLPT